MFIDNTIFQIMLKFLLGIVVTLIVAGIIVGAYFLGLKQTGKASAPVPNPTATAQTTISVIPESTTASPTQKAEFVNPSVTIANIEDSVKSKNYAALEGYMASSVSVGIAASECCGTLSPTKATEQLSYLTKGTDPWDFSDANPIAAKLRTADPANFKDDVIGTAANRFAVGFHLNNKYLIDRIFMTIDYKLIAP